MSFEIKKIKSSNQGIEYITNRRKVFVYRFDTLVKAEKIIEDKIFLNFDIKIQFKENRENNKFILYGENNGTFWFYKIIRINEIPPYKFLLDKPVGDIRELNLYILDWYNVIKRIEMNKIEIEMVINYF